MIGSQTRDEIFLSRCTSTRADLCKNHRVNGYHTIHAAGVVEMSRMRERNLCHLDKRSFGETQMLGAVSSEFR